MKSNLFGAKPKPARKPRPQHHGDSVIETFRDLGSNVKNSLKSDVASGMANDALSSLFGAPRKTSGEFRPSAASPEAAITRGAQAKKANEIDTAALAHADRMETAKQIDAVRQELKGLAASLKTLNTQIEQAISQIPVDPGVYHATFFERLRSEIHMARLKIDDSNSWLSVSYGRQKKKGFWNKYKKHGTKFGLSSERTVATQTA